MFSRITIPFLIISFFLSLYSCQNSSTIPTSEKLEIYSIIMGNDTTKVGKLTYKEIKFFNAEGDVVKQEFYNKEGSLKGIEYIDKNKSTRHSEYFTPDSILLSYYNLTYTDEQVQKKDAFDGSSNEYLRSEEYKFDSEGNRTEKIIYDVDGSVSRVYKFVYDEYGNETGFSGFDEKGQMFLLETYVITDMDKENRWIEKWGKRDNVPFSYYKRTITN